MIKSRVFIFFLLFACMQTHAQDLYLFASATDSKRYNTLIHAIRCVVCQNQTIADSNAPLANDMREKIYRMLLEKKDETAIKRYFVRRYGDFILLEPPFNWRTATLWLFPLWGLILLSGLIIFYRLRSNS